MVFMRMARRLVEKMYAIPSKTMMPSKPENRAISSLPAKTQKRPRLSWNLRLCCGVLVLITLNYAMNQGPFLQQGRRADLVCRFRQPSGLFKLGTAVIAKRAQRLACAYLVPNFLVNHDAHGRIDYIFFGGSSAAQQQAGDADFLAVDTGYLPGIPAHHAQPVARRGQQ